MAYLLEEGGRRAGGLHPQPGPGDAAAARPARPPGSVLRLMLRERPQVVHTHKAKAGAIGRAAAAAVPGAGPGPHLPRPRAARLFRPGQDPVLPAARAAAGPRPPAGWWSPRPAWPTSWRASSRWPPRDQFEVDPAGLRPRAVRPGRGATGASCGRSWAWTRRRRWWASWGGWCRSRTTPPSSPPPPCWPSAGPTCASCSWAAASWRRTIQRGRRSAAGWPRARHFLGWRKDLARIYADLDVVALSSINEGTPVSLIEAMAAGTPVVSTAVGGVPDVLRAGTAASWCRPAIPRRWPRPSSQRAGPRRPSTRGQLSAISAGGIRRRPAVPAAGAAVRSAAQSAGFTALAFMASPRLSRRSTPLIPPLATRPRAAGQPLVQGHAGVGGTRRLDRHGPGADALLDEPGHS